VITKLHYEMYMPGELIVKANTKGDKMFFIQEGTEMSFYSMLVIR